MNNLIFAVIAIAVAQALTILLTIGRYCGRGLSLLNRDE